MENILETIFSNVYVSAILGIFTLVGLPLTIIYNYKNKQRKILAISERTKEIIKKNSLEKLKTTFENIEIKNLYKTEFIFWNNGNTCLKKEDMAEPIKVVFNKESMVLKIEIVSITDKSNKISIKNKKDNLFELCFDYLKKKQGAKIIIYHTGENIKFNTIIKMKEGKNIIERSEFSADMINKKGVNLEPIFNLYYILVASILPIYMIIKIIQDKINNIPIQRLPLCIVSICIMLIGIIGFLIGTIPTIKNELKLGIPKELK